MKKENKKAAHAATITTKKKMFLSQMLQNHEYFRFFMTIL